MVASSPSTTASTARSIKTTYKRRSPAAPRTRVSAFGSAPVQPFERVAWGFWVLGRHGSGRGVFEPGERKKNFGFPVFQGYFADLSTGASNFVSLSTRQKPAEAGLMGAGVDCGVNQNGDWSTLQRHCAVSRSLLGVFRPRGANSQVLADSGARRLQPSIGASRGQQP